MVLLGDFNVVGNENLDKSGKGYPQLVMLQVFLKWVI